MNTTHTKPLIALIAAAFILTSCGGALSSTIDVKSGTAKIVYAEALKLGQFAYPAAYLIGYNNHGNTFERPTSVPPKHETSGATGTWFYLFAKDRNMLTDGTLTDDETFGVEFKAGTVSVNEHVALGDYTVTSDVLFGTDLLAFDSDALYTKALEAITKKAPVGLKPLHVDFRITPGVSEVTLFTTTGSGYTARFDMKKGEVTNVDQISLG